MPSDPGFDGGFHKSPGKWLSRAMAYETLLAEEGVEAAEKYIARYLPKIDRLFEALWKLHLLKQKCPPGRRM